jgi:hypothetical protein
MRDQVRGLIIIFNPYRSIHLLPQLQLHHPVRDNLRQSHLHIPHKLRRSVFICLLLVFTILLGIIDIW